MDGQVPFRRPSGIWIRPGSNGSKEPVERLIEHYLLDRKSLQLCFLILDARRGWMDKDLELKEWLEFHNRRYIVIATKTDKLKLRQNSGAESKAIRSHSPDKEPLPFSAVTVPGSEGNLASDIENQEPAAVAAPTTEEKPEKIESANGDAAGAARAKAKATEPDIEGRRRKSGSR